jgi:hypothetical protein
VAAAVAVEPRLGPVPQYSDIFMPVMDVPQEEASSRARRNTVEDSSPSCCFLATTWTQVHNPNTT